VVAHSSTITVDIRGNNSSSCPRFPRIPNYIDAAVDVSRRIRSIFARQGTLDDILEHLAFTSLAESSFAEDWDSPEDAIYDDL